ncbi:MAG: hypothetical protein J5764_02140 [Bacteroidales bacterium]|nr:hypothetical protein [Bacteroidales bacterium]
MIDGILSILVVLNGLFPMYRGQEYAFVRAESTVEGGSYRNIYDPALSVKSSLGAEAVKFTKSLMLRGYFNYGYDYGTESRWKGWTDPYETPFMLCDSIPGNISQETYDMGAAIAIPAGKWRFGVDARYRATIFAKHKDLRNKNTRMDVSVAPSVAWCGDKFRAGLSAGYLRNTEQVEYMQVDASTEKYLFRLYGLWLYSSSGFASAENRRYKENSGAFSDFRLEYEDGPLLLRNDFHVRYSYGSQTETGYNNLHYGDTEYLGYSDVLLMRYGAHRLTARWNMNQTLGLRSVQRQELDPDSKIRRWYTYGGLSETYYRQIMAAGGDYSFKKEKWSVSAGMDWTSEAQYYREYPILFSQRLSVLEPHLGGSVRLDAGKKAGWLVLEASAGYRQPLIAVCDDIKVLGGMASEGGEWQLMQPLEEEFNYRSAASVGVGLNANLTLPLPKKGRSLEFRLGVQHRSAVATAVIGRFRTGGTLSVKYNF